MVVFQLCFAVVHCGAYRRSTEPT